MRVADYIWKTLADKGVRHVFLVTGDAARNKEMCLPGGGWATVKIELPKNWDTLMSARGYAPLSTFTLTSDLKPDIPKPRVRPYAAPGIRGARPQRRFSFRVAAMIDDSRRIL
mgnify:CR=1 FL=1